ncbi:Fur family transcriptional regulator, ferric uptake regulator [Parasporobacterium paucivorans DSM 15970]|uniref:Fur family transcriptional regulator, ferric uptake regulator n=1 Tax=Parasporobacterium paucivorans DSM 15970 TaxID=1122934 RepID=A0A1M6C0I1_9FIRM|nr:Fur family transcriptional regulator [Parasporobacterium paucivorans]SHI54244.1 Fur family transcriptional regulator, ferric uptake regulator [Parasporobacterium paucivorans DSM 15970]
MNQENFKDQLKEKGLKVTSQRVAVLEVLDLNRGKHLTTEELYELVKAMSPDIGLATVYRTVQLLLDMNLIDRITLDDGSIRYEIAEEKDKLSGHHHHHLICLDCGDIVSFADDLLENLEDNIRKTTGFEVVDHEVKLYGYCRACSEKHL